LSLPVSPVPPPPAPPPGGPSLLSAPPGGGGGRCRVITPPPPRPYGVLGCCKPVGGDVNGPPSPKWYNRQRTAASPGKKTWVPPPRRDPRKRVANVGEQMDVGRAPPTPPPPAFGGGGWWGEGGVVVRPPPRHTLSPLPLPPLTGGPGAGHPNHKRCCGRFEHIALAKLLNQLWDPGEGVGRGGAKKETAPQTSPVLFRSPRLAEEKDVLRFVSVVIVGR